MKTTNMYNVCEAGLKNNSFTLDNVIEYTKVLPLTSTLRKKLEELIISKQ